jgi:hypothetical protein
METTIENQISTTLTIANEKDNLKNWISLINLTEVSLANTDNMLLAVELRDKLVAYKKWALLQIEQKAK